MSLIASGRVIIVERDQYGNVRYVVENSDPYCIGDPPFLYWNTPQTYTAVCPYDRAGDSVTVIVNGGTFYSATSQAEANALALAEATSEANASIVCSCLPVGFYNYCDGGNLYQYHEDGACNKSSVILIQAGAPGCAYTTTTTTTTTTLAPCWPCPVPTNIAGPLYETNVLAYGSVYGAVFKWNGSVYVLVTATKQGTMVYFYPAPGTTYVPGGAFYIVIDGVPICGNLPGGATTTTTTTTTSTTTHGPCIELTECENVSPDKIAYHIIYAGIFYMFVFVKLSSDTWRLNAVTPFGIPVPAIGHDFSTSTSISVVLNGLTFCILDPLAICDTGTTTTTTSSSTTTGTTTPTTTTTTSTTTGTTSTTTTSTTTTPTVYWNTAQTYTVDCDTPHTTTTSTTPTTTTSTTTGTTTYTTSTTTLNPCNANACLATGGTWGSNYPWGDPLFNFNCGTCQHSGGPLVYCNAGC